jgi:hypothetical protein
MAWSGWQPKRSKAGFNIGPMGDFDLDCDMISTFLERGIRPTLEDVDATALVDAD